VLLNQAGDAVNGRRNQGLITQHWVIVLLVAILAMLIGRGVGGS